METKYPKELLQLERHAFAVTKAMPELKAAYDNLTGIDCLNSVREIGKRFGLSL